MMCSAYFGALSETRKIKWDNEETNPYEVLESPMCLDGKGHSLLAVGYKYFRERITIDWGSYAWKCTPEEIYRFFADNKTTFSWLVEDEEKMIKEVEKYILEREHDEFGIVFIEEC